MAMHTGGPWRWNEIGSSGRFRLEQANPDFDTRPPILVATEIREADALLISAAPALLAACEAALRLLTGPCSDPDQLALGEKRVAEIIEAAVALATGK